jgi:hypothetical protein
MNWAKHPIALDVAFPHRVRFTGPLAALWGTLVGRKIAAGFPTVMANVAKAAGRH